MPGAAARTVWNMPERLTCSSCSHAAGAISAIVARLFTMPALFTRMSGAPSSAAHAATASTTASASDTSTATAIDRRPSSATAAAVDTTSSGPDVRARSR